MSMDDVKSPLLKSAIESLDHGLYHSTKDTPKDWRFAILHVDQAVELILKERLMSRGQSIYKHRKTLTLHETFEKLMEKGIEIPEKPFIEDAREIRNITQHRGHTITKETILYYVNIEYDFCKKFLKNERDIDISKYIKSRKKASFSSKEQIKSVYKQINENPADAILGIFGALEFTAYQDFPNKTLDSLISELQNNNSITESEHEELLKAYKLKSKITDGLYDPSTSETKNAVEIVSKIIKIISNSDENKPLILKDFPKMIEKYIKTKKLELSTVRTYKDVLYKFYIFLTEEKDVSNMKKLLIAFKKYIDFQKNEKSENTIYLMTNIIKKFLEFYEIDTLEIKLPKRIKSIPKLLTEQEVENVINAFDKPRGKLSKHAKVRNLRDKLLLTLIYSSRLKVSEIRFLLIDNLNLNEKKIKLAETDEDDYISFNNNVKILIEEYYQERDDDNKFLFINKSGNPLSTRGIEIIVNKHAETAGIKKKVNPTILKHSFKAHLLEKGTDMMSIGSLNDRQSSLDTT